MFRVYKCFLPEVAVGYEEPRVQVHISNGKTLIFWPADKSLLLVLYGAWLFNFNKRAGVEFMKTVPQGTYDAIMLDAFQNMGIFSFLIIELPSYSK